MECKVLLYFTPTLYAVCCSAKWFENLRSLLLLSMERWRQGLQFFAIVMHVFSCLARCLEQLSSSMIGIHKGGWRQGLQFVFKNVHQVTNLFSRLDLLHKCRGSLARCLELNLYTVVAANTVVFAVKRIVVV